MVDAAYHLIWEELKPEVRENDIVARVNKLLFDLGWTTSRRLTRFRASVATLTRTISPIVCFDPAIRPSSISCIPSSAIGPATTGPLMSVARLRLSTTPTSLAGNGWTTPSTCSDLAFRPTRSSKFGPRRKSRIPGRDGRIRLQFGHGIGLALHERPIISRLVSLEAPMEIKTGMVFALETYFLHRCTPPPELRRRSSSPIRDAKSLRCSPPKSSRFPVDISAYCVWIDVAVCNRAR